MSERPHVEILFILDGERYASRFWPHVPRVGDEVMLHDKAQPERNDRHDKAPFRVIRVVWGTEAKNASAHDPQCCNIEVERVP